jgi:hypothetical protein
VKSNRQRFDHGKLFSETPRRYDFLPRNGNVFLHGAIALDTQCLIELARIEPSFLTRRTLSAIGIRHNCYSLPFFEILRNFFSG